jgi:hypothetical protein
LDNDQCVVQFRGAMIAQEVAACQILRANWRVRID